MAIACRFFRAHSRAAHLPVAVVRDVGEHRHQLAGRPDGRYSHLVVVELLADHLLRLPGGLPGKVSGVAKLGLPVLDEQVLQRIRPAVEHYPVPARRLELGADAARRDAETDESGRRRARAHDVLGGDRHRCPGDRAAPEAQHVLGPQSVGALRHLVVKRRRDEAVAPEKLLSALLVQALRYNLARRHVHS